MIVDPESGKSMTAMNCHKIPASLPLKFLTRSLLSNSFFPELDQTVSDGQQADVQPVVDQAPQTARQEERESDGNQTQTDQVPGAQIRELVLNHEEQDRSDDRPFERAESTD